MDPAVYNEVNSRDGFERVVSSWDETRPIRCIAAALTRVYRRASPCFGAMEDYPRCVGCHKTFRSVEALRAHQEKAQHDAHDPRCGACGRLFRSMASLREHLKGKLAKATCSEKYEKRGCSRCLRILKDPEEAESHICFPRRRVQKVVQAGNEDKNTRVVALDCEMVAVEGNEEVGACARVCMVDEDEHIVLDTYVQPEAKVLDYRESITGVRSEHLANAPSREFVASLVQAVLKGADIRYNGKGGLDVDFSSLHNADRPPRLLVGHDLWHDLSSLGISHPIHLQRDTANYPPLRRANGQRQKLRELCHLHLGWQIQASNAPHCPFEDAKAAMKLYWFVLSYASEHEASLNQLALGGWKHCRENYQCWCLDLQSRLFVSQQLPTCWKLDPSIENTALNRVPITLQE